jgi:hypothetical protein
VPSHDHWKELFDEVESDPLPWWTRIGARLLPNELFPRDYRTNPVLRAFGPKRGWKDNLDIWLLLMVAHALVYPALAIFTSSFIYSLPLMFAVLFLSTFTLPVLAAAHAHGFLVKRLARVPFNELVLTRLTPAEIAQALALPPLADTRAMVLFGGASFLVCTAFVNAFSGDLALLVIGALFATFTVYIQLRATIYSGIAAVHVALTRSGWFDTFKRIAGHVALLGVGFVTVLIMMSLCFCIGLAGAIGFAIILRDKTSDVALELWSHPEEWYVYEG